MANMANKYFINPSDLIDGVPEELTGFGESTEPVSYIVMLADPTTDAEWTVKLTVDPAELNKYLDMYEEQYGYIVEAYDRFEDTMLEDEVSFRAQWNDFMEELATEGCLMAG